MLRTICASFLAFLTAGCALFPLQEADCRGVDWYQRGEGDGFGGHPPQDLRLTRECGRFGVRVPEAEYLEGWRAGYDEWYRMIGSIGVD